MNNSLLTESSVVESSNGWRYNCADADLGRYSLSDPVIGKLERDPSASFKACAFILEARLLGEKRSVAICDNERPPLEEREHWVVQFDEVTSAWPSEPVKMFDRALVNISRLAKWPGDEVEITKKCERLLYAQSPEQTVWMLRQLQNSGYINHDEGTTHDALGTLTIEGAGWQQVSELLRKSKPANPEAFVAMAFNDEMRPFYSDGFLPAVEADGKTKCVRIDRVHHNNKICDEIIAAIRRCRYVVADFTGNRGGVYYEAGFAHGLGIPVIWTVKDSADDLHFDTRQYNHIVYKTALELRESLQNRIAATIV